MSYKALGKGTISSPVIQCLSTLFQVVERYTLIGGNYWYCIFCNVICHTDLRKTSCQNFGVMGERRGPWRMTSSSMAQTIRLKAPPFAGTHNMGELYLDNQGMLYFCVANGTPGTLNQITSRKRYVVIPSKINKLKVKQVSASCPFNQLMILMRWVVA